MEPHAATASLEELGVYSASLDLQSVGSRGYGPIGRLIHGSTSQQLARTARCPFLVLTAPLASSRRLRRQKTVETLRSRRRDDHGCMRDDQGRDRAPGAASPLAGMWTQ